jgi:hypothetical protein
MKKLVLAVAVFLMWVGVAGAVVTTAPGDVITQISNPTAIAGAAAGASASVRDTNTVSPKITTKVDTKTTVNPVINAGQTIAPTQSLQVTAPRDAIDVPIINIPTAPILNGKVFSADDMLPNFLGLKKYNGEPVEAILDYQYKILFPITIEKLPALLLKEAESFSDTAHTRFHTLCFDKSGGWALGLGGGSAITASDGNSSNGMTVGGSVSSAVVKPRCAVYIYLVK